MPSAADWKRLGSMLIRRRVELDPRYRNRGLFAEKRGVNARLVSDIEKARRTRFEAASIALLERAYDLDPGAIDRFLAGGELVPAKHTAPTRLGRHLARHRDSGWDDFAATHGLPLEWVIRLETDPHPDFSEAQLTRLADAYGVPVEDLRQGITSGELPQQADAADPRLKRISYLWPGLDEGARDMLASLAERMFHGPAQDAVRTGTGG